VFVAEDSSAMTKREIRIFDDLEHLSWAAATRFEELARIKAIEKKIFTAALSGGSTPKFLYEIFGRPAFAGRVRWPNVHLFQVDERCVGPDDPASNYRLIRQAMLESSPLPQGNFHRMAAELPDREQAARDYAGDLARVLQPAPGKVPRLELVFLGMGPDGHTASLFPGSAALDEQTAWVVPNYVGTLQAFRLTLTLPVLNAAAHVIFMVTGEDKAATLREVLEGPPERFPAQRVQPARGRVSWFVDKGAARLLGAAARG
jgi:6-phosphogluconolactonase